MGVLAFGLASLSNDLPHALHGKGCSRLATMLMAMEGRSGQLAAGLRLMQAVQAHSAHCSHMQDDVARTHSNRVCCVQDAPDG